MIVASKTGAQVRRFYWVGRQHGKAKGSGVDISSISVFFHIWTVRDGKVVRHEAYFDREKALEAAGLKR